MPRNYLELGSNSKIVLERFDIFNELRQSDELCDVSLIIDEGIFRVHKVVLATGSPYFRSMFTSNLLEAKMDEVAVPGIDYATMHHLIQYMYTTRLRITIENAQNILLAANYLQMTELIDTCAKFIVSHIDVTNCLSMKPLLTTVNCDVALIKKVDRFIFKNFQKAFLDRENFVKLDVNDVLGILASDELQCDSEEVVFNCAMWWLEADWEQRHVYAYHIFQCIRLAFLPTKLKNDLIYQNPMFQNVPNCHQLIRNHISYTPTPTTPRIYLTSIVALVRGDEEISCQIYDKNTKIWSKLVDVPQKCYRHIISHGDCIYVLGHQCFDKYDFLKKQWFELPIGIGNCWEDSIVTVVRNEIHIFNHGCQSIQVYDIQKKCWRIGMDCRNETRSLVSIDWMLYAIEKRTRDDNNMNYVYIRELDTGPQEFLNDRYTGRSSFCDAVVFRDNIYIVGESTFDVYNPKNRTEEQLAAMSSVKVSLVATSDGIYAYGRSTNEATNKKSPMFLRFYDISRNEWREESTLPFELFSTCTVPSCFSGLVEH